MLRVTLVGCGGLGSALAKGLAANPQVSLTVCEKHREKVEKALPDGGFRFESEVLSAVETADVIVVAVKPDAVPSVLERMNPGLPDESLTVSCAAGLPLDTLAAHQTQGALARAMPNTGAAVNACTTAVVLGARAEEARDLERLRVVFGAVGELLILPREELMHAATAVGGSGPAFMLLALEALTDAALAQGFGPEDASVLARGALRAASALADAGEHPPAELRARITSPNGTTAAGLAALGKGGFREALTAAVEAAVARSKEMAGE